MADCYTVFDRRAAESSLFAVVVQQTVATLTQELFSLHKRPEVQRHGERPKFSSFRGKMREHMQVGKVTEFVYGGKVCIDACVVALILG